MDRAEGNCDIFRHRSVDLADVAQGEVKLLLVLPRPARRAILHRGEAGLADRGGRAERDEQAVHGQALIPPRDEPRPDSLEENRHIYDIEVCKGLLPAQRR